MEEEAADGETSEESLEKTVVPEDSAQGGGTEEEGLPLESSPKTGDVDSFKEKHFADSSSPVRHEEAGNVEKMTSTPFSSPMTMPLCVPPPFLLEEDQEMDSDTLIMAPGGEAEEEEDGSPGAKGDSHDRDEGDGAPATRSFRDPLQDDTGMFVAEQVDSSDDRLKSISAGFKQELKEIILCISPFITFREPFLLTPAGMHCPSRDYFPEQVPRFSSSFLFRLLQTKDFLDN